MRPHKSSSLRSEAGFTLVECLVAAAVLLIGLMGTFALLDGATGAEGASATREGATNIAKEFLEGVKGEAYTAISPTSVNNDLTTLSGASGSGPYYVTRRNIRYTVSAAVCSIDDPKDGTGTTATPQFCSNGTASSPADNQPDDLKKVSITVSWTGRRAGSTTQAAMLSSSGATIGLTTQTLTMAGSASPSPTITSSTTAASCPTNRACFTAASAGAVAIKFAVDGTDQTGSTGVTQVACTPAPSPCAQWQWDYSSLSDGTYRISARSLDATGTEGPPHYLLVTIAQNKALTPVCGVGSDTATCLPIEGGYNYLPGSASTPIFEMRWAAKPERNVTGYTVTRGGTTICTLDAQGNFVSGSGTQGPDSYSCVDQNPPTPWATPATYSIVANYANLANPSAPRTSPAATVSGTGAYLSAQKVFGFDPTAPNVTGCQDPMTAGFIGTPANSINSATGSKTLPKNYLFCSPTAGTMFPTATSIFIDGNVSVNKVIGDFNTSTAGRTCTISWDVLTGTSGSATTGSIFSSSPTGTLSLQPGNPREQQFDDTAPIGSTPFSLGSTLRVIAQLTTTGPNCDNARFVYGGKQTSLGSAGPGLLTVNFVTGTAPGGAAIAKPTAPTTVSWSSSGGNTTLNWTGPAGASFYRIYRDGQLLANRYDTCDVGDLFSAGGCDKGSNQFTYTDSATGGASHTYRVTTVNSSLTESTQTPIPSTGVAIP